MAQSKLEILIQARNNAKKEFDGLNKQVNQLQGGAGSKGGGLKGLSSSFQKLTGFSLAAGGAIGVAGMALKKMYEYSKVAIAAASDLAESESKVGVVFGDQADAMLAWGQTAAEAMGMSSNEALAAAGTYGNLFRAMGITEKASADMSQALVELAADLASFNNMDPTEVLGKLRAGLSGETEPLKTLGVNLNQVIIQQKALELGLWDGVGALDAAQKAQASYALILEQTSLAQGDFERTSDGLANQQRILKAASEDLAAAIGEYLLPAQTEIVKSQTQLVIGIKDTIDEWNDERSQLERLGLVYDQHIGYMKDGVLLTAEQVNEMKRADRANQAWTASLEAQADAYFALNPETRTSIQNYTDLKTSIDDVNVLMKDYTAQLLFNQAAAGLDADASMILAEKMGLIDDETATAMDRLGHFRQMLADGQITIEQYTSLVAGLDKNIRGLPASKEIRIVVRGEIDASVREAESLSGQGRNAYIGLTGSNRAVGGPVTRGTPYIVGEVGPELFVPGQSGQIVPNNQLGGSKVINFYYSPAMSLSDKAEAETKIKPMLKQLLSEV